MRNAINTSATQALSHSVRTKFTDCDMAGSGGGKGQA